MLSLKLGHAIVTLSLGFLRHSDRKGKGLEESSYSRQKQVVCQDIRRRDESGVGFWIRFAGRALSSKVLRIPTVGWLIRPGEWALSR